MDTWRSAYRGIVPDSHLDGLSYAESERLWHDRLTGADEDGCAFVADGESGISGFASGRRRRRFSQGLREYEGKLETIYVLPSGQGKGAGKRLAVAVARHFVGRGVNSMLLWAFADNRPARRFYESLGGIVVAEDGFELAGAWLSEVAYGWTDLDVLLASVDDG